MAKFKRRDEKRADDGSLLILYQDIVDDSWFVGKPGDSALDPIPMGAFCSASAARRWADERFPGGTWTGIRKDAASDETQGVRAMAAH